MAVRGHDRTRSAVSINERLFLLGDSKGGRPVLVGGRCPDCGCHFFPTRAICPGCGRVGLETVDLSAHGRVWTYTIVHQAPPGAVVQAPYVIARIELPEGVLISSLVTDCPPDGARIGMDVEMVPMKVGEDEEGCDVLAFAFRPVREAEEMKR